MHSCVIRKRQIWLDNQLKAQGYNDYKDIMLATIDGNDNLCVYKAVNEENDTDVFD